uniref:Phosphohistidine phosphatase 1 n=1 Tax=Athene cunicularia TaxID=194338 RepID=A0A663LSV2_ATHCN
VGRLGLGSLPSGAARRPAPAPYILPRVGCWVAVGGPTPKWRGDHIFEKVNPEMEKLGYECKCLGGGKIDHNSKDKKIRVFGLSTGYGKADHSVTVEILKKVYTDYEITWSDDKK